MKKNLVVALCAIVVAFSACTDNKKVSTESNSTGNNTSVEVNSSTAEQSKPVDAKASFEITPINVEEDGDNFIIHHSLGTSSVVKAPTKVVVLDLGILDSFSALNLNDNVVGVPIKNLPRYLVEFSNKNSIGGVQQVDLEAINALKPDLIIISGRQAKYYDKLKEIAPTAFMGIGYDNASFLNSFKTNTLALAKLYGKEAEANEKIALIEGEISKAKEELSKDKKALIIMTNANKISAFGPSSRFGLIHDILGINPVDDSIKVGTHGKSINYEYILETNPDFIFIVDRNVIVGKDKVNDEFLNNALIKKTKAANEGKIVFLDPEYWYLVGGNGIKSLSAMIKEVVDGVK
ncbi:siderophore ABC transporter substrate-binding protein [Campylobacter sp. LR291e]|uniref:siderophore ABC transporter substrate-binding protein n=1 Tax=Campylobacter sp. LR291e TaxID=2593546 RepID=UPI00123A2CAD|nr:siderophore ABC transporter substrate-binding protein [Campylobacter sp. LR291e]KAA6230786.1 siderophore ABC transporter substrate-binding protein [Campylobacter sp. LR291e]